MSFVGDSVSSGSTSLPLGGSFPREGLVIGRHYALHQKIGVGGMATVYLGWLAAPADFTRVVAIKRLHSQLAFDEHFVTRFRDEARLNACLSHPNIAQVFDVVEQNRELLIVMEYVHGVPLDGMVKDANAHGFRLPLPIVTGVLAPALHALHALHEATDDEGKYIGTVHRDFTPPNILVTREGYSKLIDLGIAKARIDEHVTSPGKFAGKLGYCSPEQIRTGAVDRRTDVFAAGVVLWELLTGQHLFHHRDNQVETMRCVLEQPIPAPSSLNPEVPEDLDQIVLRATQRAPECRFANAQELAFALEAATNPARPSLIAEWLGMVCARRMAKLTRRLNRTRRCMAGTGLGPPLRERASEETRRYMADSGLGAVPRERATEKTTVPQPRPAAIPTEAVPPSAASTPLPRPAAIPAKAIPPSEVSTPLPRPAAIPAKAIPPSAVSTPLPRPAAIPAKAIPPSAVSTPRPRPAAIPTKAAGGSRNEPGSNHAPWLKSLGFGAFVLALATGSSFGRQLFSQSVAPSKQPSPAPQVAPIRHHAPEVVLLPSPPPEPVQPPEIPSLPVLVVAPEERQAQEVPSRARVQPARVPPRSSKPRTPRKPSPVFQALAAPQVASQPDCDPPTYLDEDGIRVFKLECL